MNIVQILRKVMSPGGVCQKVFSITQGEVPGKLSFEDGEALAVLGTGAETGNVEGRGMGHVHHKGIWEDYKLIALGVKLHYV